MHGIPPLALAELAEGAAPVEPPELPEHVMTGWGAIGGTTGTGSVTTTALPVLQLVILAKDANAAGDGFGSTGTSCPGTVGSGNGGVVGKVGATEPVDPELVVVPVPASAGSEIIGSTGVGGAGTGGGGSSTGMDAVPMPWMSSWRPEAIASWAASRQASPPSIVSK
jgi:hypothetical protein